MEHGFFKWVWRYNGLVIAVAATLILGIILWEMTSDLRRSLNPRVTNVVAIPSPTADGTPADPADLVERTYFSGSLRTNRKSLYAMRLYREQTYTNNYVSKDSTGNLINYVIVDSTTGTTRPLFEGNERLILDHYDLKTYPPRGESYGVGTILTVVETDTNGDGRLSRNDTWSTYFVDPDWTGPVKLLESVEDLQHWHVNETDGFDLIFSKDGQVYLQQFDLPDATPGKLIEIPNP